MSRPRKSVPSYRLHRQSGQAVVTLPDVFGGRPTQANVARTTIQPTTNSRVRQSGTDSPQT